MWVSGCYLSQYTLISIEIMEFVTTQRGARSLIYEGHKYLINWRGRDGQIFWRYANSRQCEGAVTTKEDEIVSSRADEHNHAFKNGRQFPLVYCLLPGKSHAVYLRALEIIKQKKSEDLAPAEVLTDFELAIIQAVELTFPTTEVKGCFYHFAQALNKKIATLGLQCAYRQNPDVSKFVRKTVALAFVAQWFVCFAWHGIKMQVPKVEKMDEFVTYFEETGWWATLVLDYETSPPHMPAALRPTTKMAQQVEANCKESPPQCVWTHRNLHARTIKHWSQHCSTWSRITAT